jgi:transglutaminase-like putative cysteine protease
MKFKILHTTDYHYSEEVFFEPHYLRFKPKITPYLDISAFDIQIDPEPSGFSEHIDIENNHIRLYWFENMHKNLSISVNSIIEIKAFNPFNFLIFPPEYSGLPFKYAEANASLLMPALKTVSLSDSIHQFVDDALRKSNYNTLQVLTELTSRIHHEFKVEIREDGNPLPPEISFDQKRGSCRDLSWMLIHILRNIGIASRFVSGYFYLDSEHTEFELHAWVEAYLPGAGWIGIDPSHGIFTGTHHFPVASSAYFELTMPVSGSVRGSAIADMKTGVCIFH